jgi:hypothetical protein
MNNKVYVDENVLELLEAEISDIVGDKLTNDEVKEVAYACYTLLNEEEAWYDDEDIFSL